MTALWPASHNSVLHLPKPVITESWTCTWFSLWGQGTWQLSLSVSSIYTAGCNWLVPVTPAVAKRCFRNTLVDGCLFMAVILEFSFNMQRWIHKLFMCMSVIMQCAHAQWILIQKNLRFHNPKISRQIWILENNMKIQSFASLLQHRWCPHC